VRRRWLGLAVLNNRWLGRLALVVAVLVVAVGTWDYLQPVPTVAATSYHPAQVAIAGPPPNLPWPGVGSAAVGVSGLGLIATSGDVPPAPVASVAKVMTAMVVLADKPLAKGDSGPILIMTDQDYATYTADAAQGQSVVPVAVGEQMTEFEALQALLIPSGNNIAETLARWDAGSVPAFVSKMNGRAASLQLAHTTFVDPAGLSTQTVSTPADLLAMGMAAMRQEVLAQIVGLAEATLPVAGTVYNVNAAIGQSGITGIKTGSGLNSGATFLFAATASIDGQPLTIYGCVMGQPTLDAAFTEAQALISTMRDTLRVRQVVSVYDVVGAYQSAWGGSSVLEATTGATLVEWPGMILRQRLDAKTLVIDGTVPNGMSAGNLHLVLGDQQVDIPLVTQGTIDPPGTPWRLFRINL
jgi:serine-type D-Ala-D-Ala carboxypeptidase (penicillin-binding protein 5/6)